MASANSTSTVPAPAWSSILSRAAATTARAACTLPALAGGTLVVRSVAGRDAAQRYAARRVVRLLQRLGPAFVKAGQLVGTRRDLLPPAVVEELATLQEAVRPMPAAQARRALRQEYGAELDTLFRDLTHEPVASGSIACVYRATLADGRPVALKLRRPGIDRRMAADLALIRALTRVVARLPRLRGVPVVAMVDRVSEAVQGQVDLTSERAHLAMLGRTLSRLPTAVVPGVHHQASRAGCLVMDFVADLRLDAVADSGRLVRTRLAHATLDVVFEMLFVNGFVHCDLHPGNLYHRTDGRVVVLDAGFCVWLDEDTRWDFSQFFFNFGRGNGRRCAEIVIGSAAGRHPDADTERFTAGVIDLVRRTSRVPARDFSLIAFTAELFDLQRSCGLYASPDFVFPLVSIMAIEGTLRDLEPGLDFQAAAMPALLEVLATRPTTGKETRCPSPSD
ncbi:ABC1 kinase family protein [Jidongwangia harbinensis]|uniref:ABC1 kinase family protein n=1 Tax=Jidongwangia harbinensis TaxID=2878561 RepID=UPI001CDA0875|nr:AarF/UbiB family protein [Jidongwangia harbinensis]MCA2218275.1 phosphotransferase [Jidongwangia harbinensis]